MKGTSKTMTVAIIPASGEQFEVQEAEPPNDRFLTHVLTGPETASMWKKVLRSAKDRILMIFGRSRSRSQIELRSQEEKLEKSGAELPGARSVALTLKSDAPVGNHSGRLRIRTDLEKKPLLEVDVHASVVGDLKVSPKHRNLGNIRKGQEKEGTFTISSRTGKVFEVTGVKSSSEYVSAKVSQVVPGTEYKVVINVRPDAPVGRLNGAVAARTTDPDYPEIDLRFYVNITQ